MAEYDWNITQLAAIIIMFELSRDITTGGTLPLPQSTTFVTRFWENLGNLRKYVHFSLQDVGTKKSD